jgi:hypothetical protein
MKKAIYIVYPTSQLRIKTQKDFACLYFYANLLADSKNKDYFTDFVNQEFNTWDCNFRVAINRAYLYFSLEYPQEFEKEATQYFKSVIDGQLNMDSINFVRFDIIDELKADSQHVQLFDKYCKENFSDFHRFRDAGTIYAVDKIEEEDIFDTEIKFLESPYFVFTSSDEDEGKVQGDLLPTSAAQFKHPLPYTQLVEIEKLDVKMLVIADTRRQDFSFLFALEKYLRDEFQEIIDIGVRVLPGLYLTKIQYFKNKFTDVEIREKVDYFLENTDKFANYLEFGKKKKQSLINNNLDFKLRQKINDMIQLQKNNY